MPSVYMDPNETNNDRTSQQLCDLAWPLLCSLPGLHRSSTCLPPTQGTPDERFTHSILCLVFCLGQFVKRYTPLLYSVEKSPRLRRAN